MLKEQKKQDKQLESIQRLEKELFQVQECFRHLCGLSVFRLPPQSPIPVSKDENGKAIYLVDQNPVGLHPNCVRVFIEDGVLHCTPKCIWGIKQFLCVPKDDPLPLQKWKESRVVSSEDILNDLALLLLPTMHPGKVFTGHRLVEVVLKQRNKERNKERDGNWSRFLRLRSACDDQDKAKSWLGGMVSNQSMGPAEVRKEHREAKYWWIDIPDLTGLVLKILPTLERQREEELKAGNGNIREGKPKSVGRGKMRGGDSVESAEVKDAQEETDLQFYKKAVRQQLKLVGWSKGEVKRFIEENGSSNDTLTVALKKADAQGLCHKGKKRRSSTL